MFEWICGNFEALTEKKIGKNLDVIIKDSSKVFVVETLSIIVAGFLAILVGLFIIVPYSKSEQ